MSSEESIEESTEESSNASSTASQSQPQSCCHCCSCLCWIARWFPVLFVLGTTAWSYHAYVILFALQTVQSGPATIVYLFFFHIFFLLFVWSYLHAVCSRHSRVPVGFNLSADVVDKLWQAEDNEEERNTILAEAGRHLPLTTETEAGSVRYCDECEHVKPDRCHHCMICHACALKMDHHCPWINNCVAFNNYKFFILFLCYLVLYCLFIAGTLLPYFVAVVGGNADNDLDIIPPFCAAISFAGVVGVLLGYHVYLMLVNRTTMEAFHSPKFRAGHGAGFSSGKCNNFREVFGNNVLLWFLPVFSSLGDGVTFPVTRGKQGEKERFSRGV